MTTPAHSHPELEVEVETEELEGGQIALAVRVPPESVLPVRETVIAGVSRRVNIPGFRKGKAPRALLARYLDQEYINGQLLEHLVPEAYDLAVKKAEIKPLTRPDIEDAELTDEGAVTFKVTLTRRPEITLGEYRGLQATRHIAPVTEAQIEAELNRVRERSASFAPLPEEAALEKGDLAIVDYQMLLDGEVREQGSATGYPLEVGADELFPQLNDALPGAKVGEAREFEMTYPEDHSDKELAGQTATFKVTVQQARRRQLPPLDEAFARTVTNSELNTMEELRARVRENLEAIGNAMAQEDVRNQLLRQVSESAALDVPLALVQREVERRVAEATSELERRNQDLHEHLRRRGRTFEDWRADLEAEARQDVRQMLVLDEIGEREQLEVTEEEVHEEIHLRAEREGVSERELHERLERAGEWSRLVNRLYHRKIMQLLADQAQITEEIVEPTPAGEAPAEEDAPAEG